MDPVIGTDKERIVLLEAGHSAINLDLAEIKTDVKDIKAEMSNRPSWAVARYITTVTSAFMLLLGGVVTYVVSRG